MLRFGFQSGTVFNLGIDVSKGYINPDKYEGIYRKINESMLRLWQRD